MLIYSMSVSVDGFIADREGGFGWTVPSDELFRFHLAEVRKLGGYLCGRRLYETGRRRCRRHAVPAASTEDVRLDLIETRTFSSRVIYERCGRARDESD